MKRVQDKVAVVTGGASGIGLASAKLLAKEGARVLVADFNLEGAQKAVEEIRQDGGIAEATFLNATDGDSIKDMIDTAIEKFGKIQILVNNVGGTDPRKDLDVVGLDIEYQKRHARLQIRHSSHDRGGRRVKPFKSKAATM